ncbi:cobalamin biosynthesis protein CobG [Cognatishimia sp.]|uniref:cobalamin biosynthesis protein CobG n=1 Tax=Cognatishimia sp. TaxID=2211648 RepID=UPI00351394B5
MTRPAAKGWCPGAYRPMMSGDGLVVRIRPAMSRLSRAQVLGLCDLAQHFGSGVLDLTSRANLQIRGVSEEDHEALLAELKALGLLPDDPDLEARRNILMPHDWAEDDDSHRICSDLLTRLADLPDLPAKFGIAIDAGPAPVLQSASADLRIERAEAGLILRADGSALGKPTTVDAAVSDMLALAQWFSDTAQGGTRRMKTLLAQTALPDHFAQQPALAARARPNAGPAQTAIIYGAPYGQIQAQALADLIERTGARALRTTPWRLFLLEDAAPCTTQDFIDQADDPRLTIDACPGAPMCTSASVQTRDLAHQLAGISPKRLHISGCAKGCARARPAPLTLIGRDGTFDLVKDGHAWDVPVHTGLTPDDIKTRIGEF